MRRTENGFTTAAIVVAFFFIAPLAGAQDLWRDTSKPIDQRVEDLLSRLTLDEKVALCYANSKFSAPGVPRLGIPDRWMSDGPHGVREDVGPHSWDPAGRTDDFATYMPVLMSLASTWDPDLAKDYGAVVGEEARARGKDIMLGPSVNIMRTPLNGRNFEYMGEDPYLVSRMTVNYILGMQDKDVAACIKHFALNNQETQRGSIDVLADDRTLREIYLPSFRAAVQEAGVLSIMGAYNKFRGQHCCHNDLLLNQILKNEWGFKGLVMTDWGGAHDTAEAALNGLDLEMGTRGEYHDYYLANPYLTGLRDGVYPMSTVDDKARRNLYVMFATGMLDGEGARAPGSLNTRAHQEKAREIAEEGIVLLKNDHALLPLNPETIKSIALIGENAVRLHGAGGGAAGIKSFYEISPLDGILRRVGSQTDVTFSQGYREPPRRPRPTTRDVTGVQQTGATTAPTTRRRWEPPSEEELAQSDPALIERAVAAAKAADVAIVIGGLNHSRFFDAEGSDRINMKLPYGQDELIRRVVEANPRTIIVLVSGAPVEMPWIDQAPAIVQAWYAGLESGNAIARVLFGDVNPSGKLPCTFPKVLADSPAHALGAFPGENGTIEYKEGLLVGYRWFDAKEIEPLFPFGHGLSYTTFDMTNLSVQNGTGSDGPAAIVECDVTNTGDREGAEVVQVYVQDVESSLPRPQKELKGFAKVTLQPGETKRVSIPLGIEAFSFYEPTRQGWLAERGEFVIHVGSSSQDLRQKQTFRLATEVFKK